MDCWVGLLCNYSVVEVLAMALKKTACLLALALFGAYLQARRIETVRGDSNATPATQTRTSPHPGSQQANETVVPAPPKFIQDFVGTIGAKHAISMSLERNDADLTGSYFYERAGAFNMFELEKKRLK